MLPGVQVARKIRWFLPQCSAPPASDAEQSLESVVQFFAGGGKLRAQPPVEVCSCPLISPLEARIVVATWKEIQHPLVVTEARNKVPEGGGGSAVQPHLLLLDVLLKTVHGALYLLDRPTPNSPPVVQREGGRSPLSMRSWGLEFTNEGRYRTPPRMF
jgi:hypothetical protein